MPKNIIVILNTEEGRSLVRRKCRTAKVRISSFEQLVDAELDQQGKQRKRGLWEEFDRILDEDVESDAAR
jgi:hypothetical protein